ncbi:MAG: hypothetical protein JWO60_1624 [Frankiales bacterium]|nr:hypothetical protein [Frankiales bacterium]
MDALAGGVDVFETFFDQVGVGLALADLSTRYVRVNATYAELLGQRPEDLVGSSFREQLHPEGRPTQESSLTLLLRGEEATLRAEERYVRADGDELWVLHGVTVVRDAAGTALWYAVSAQDITERHRAEHDLKELTAALTERAVRDPLTGLANRALLEERLRGALARDARTGGRTGLLFLDLDGFKQVNDDHGHGVGDAVLRETAQRLLSGVRPSDTVARLGGDEFVVLVEGVTDEGLDPLAHRLETSLREPFAAEPSTRVGVSIGTATSTAGESDPAALLARADRLMYDVKRARRP